MTDDLQNTLATLLRHNVEVVVRTLTEASASPLSALVAARTASEVLDDVTHSLVQDARKAGHTWAEIGQLLRITRQAAQQRFASQRSTETETTAMSDEDTTLLRRAVQMVEELRDRDYDALRSDWNETMLEKVTVEELERIWSGLEGSAGELEAIGRPTVVQQGPFRVADVPLAFRYGPMRARISFGHDDRVAGLFLLAPEDRSNS